jgi:hypothetical protein
MSNGQHICDTRCIGENGHHAWPSPAKDQCLCNQSLRGEKVHCPMHSTSPTVPTEERLKSLLNNEEIKVFLKILHKTSHEELVSLMKDVRSMGQES